MHEINARATPEGWQLVDVFDNGSTTPYVAILGLGGLSNAQALAKVIALARQNSELHISALRIVAHSRAQAHTTRKKR